MPPERPRKRRAKTTTQSTERVRVICIRNVDFCVCDDNVPVAIYAHKADAELHRQRLLRQQAEG
jgi:hypothetical protein